MAEKSKSDECGLSIALEIMSDSQVTEFEEVCALVDGGMDMYKAVTQVVDK